MTKRRFTISEIEAMIAAENEDMISILPDGTIETVEVSSADRLRKILASPERRHAEY